VKSADATLTIWGHGGQAKFADLTSDQLVAYIKAWKKMNPTLKTVEIVTCDARHAQDDTYESFAKRVVTGLEGTGIVVKGLPVGMTGDSYSILWADNKNGFCYITATTKARFDEVNPRFQALYRTEATATPTVTASEVCNKMASGKAKEGPAGQQYSLIYSQLKTLRANLVVVR